MQTGSSMTAPSPFTSQSVSCRRPQGHHLPQPHPLPPPGTTFGLVTCSLGPRPSKGHVLREKGKPDPTPARVEKLEVLPAQVRHALTVVYLKRTDNRPDDHCWWCDAENDSTHQTRDHLFKHCYKWKDQQAAKRVRVKEVTKKGK